MLLDIFIAIIAVGLFLNVIISDPRPLPNASFQEEIYTEDTDKQDFSSRMRILQERLEQVNESKIL